MKEKKPVCKNPSAITEQNLQMVITCATLVTINKHLEIYLILNLSPPRNLQFIVPHLLYSIFFFKLKTFTCMLYIS